MLQVPLWAQSPIVEAFGEPEAIIPFDFKGVEKLEADTEGNVLLLAPGKHKIHKLLRATGYDSVVTIGGKGIEEEGFNFPTKIVVPNRQSVFVLDFYNRRIVKLNINLKVIREINFLTLAGQITNDDVTELFPFSFTIGPTGELFLFNQDDYKVYKFDTDGRLQRSFAGMDYGQGSVYEPCDIHSNAATNVFVVDCEDQSVLVYDLYGVFLYRIPVPVPFTWEGAKVKGQTIIYYADRDIYFYNMFTKNTGPHLQTENKLLDLSVNGDHLFVLTENKVTLYRLFKDRK